MRVTRGAVARSLMAAFVCAGAAGCDSGAVGAAESPASAVHTGEMPAGAAAEQAGKVAAPWVETPLVLRASAPFTGDLAEMREREVIRVLVSYSRTNFFIAESKLRGFEYELFRELEEELAAARPKGARPLHFVFFPVPFDELLPALLDGRGDIAAASLTITDAREQLVSFTEPYLTDVDEIVVAHAGAPKVAGWRDLAGQDVHVASGTAFEADLAIMNERLVAEGLAPMRIVPGGRGLKTEDMLELVHGGAIQYSICDRFVAELWAGILDGLRLETDVALRTGGEIAWAVRPGSTELKALLDDFARRNRRGTLIGNVLFKRYFGAEKWISNPLIDRETNKLEPFREALHKHAAAFGFDWRLIAAQVYQESQLDPAAVSRSGAVGLMQLLPATGKDMGVTELRDPERNLYAGVKYMDWLRRHFFDEPQLTPGAQIDFCLAAYNAGPSRVRRWRTAAPGRGLDPDVWFGNVELLALEDAGPEPVRYVGNINKYFILYALTLDGIAQQELARTRLEQTLGR